MEVYIARAIIGTVGGFLIYMAIFGGSISIKLNGIPQIIEKWRELKDLRKE